MPVKRHVSDVTKDHSRQLRREMADAERKLWSILSERQVGGVKVRRQVPFGPYVADFASHESKIVIEVDGGQHAERQEKDGLRTAFLAAEGYQVLRFWNNDVMDNLEGVYAVIAEAVDAAGKTSAFKEI